MANWEARMKRSELLSKLDDTLAILDALVGCDKDNAAKYEDMAAEIELLWINLREIARSN